MRSLASTMAARGAGVDGTLPLDTVVFRSPTVTIAAFRCPAWRPEFLDSGPIQNDIFVFHGAASGSGTREKPRSWRIRAS